MQPLAPFSAGSLSPRGFRPEDSAGRRHFAACVCGTPRFPPCAWDRHLQLGQPTYGKRWRGPWWSGFADEQQSTSSNPLEQPHNRRRTC